MTGAASPADGGSALYLGQVMHRRLRPFSHRFDYRVFSLYLDVGRLPDLAQGLRLFSHNRFNLFSFHDRDHGPRDGRPLRPWIGQVLRDHGIDDDGGPVYLHCFPRVLGYVFNPLSLYFCHRRDGTLSAVLYEVRNTFGDMHSYLIPVTGPAATGAAPIRQRAEKGFYVSPFMPMAGTYRFRLRKPDERLTLMIRQFADGGEMLIATHTGRRAPLSDRHLWRAFLRHPFVTWKVIAAIHWEAIRILIKGGRYTRRPPAPEQVISLFPSAPGAAPPSPSPNTADVRSPDTA